MGETRVDLLHLLEDLRDAYPGGLEETILTEVLANALDSGAATIRVLADAARSTLTVVDDGRGMQRHELRRFHDVAASTKRRGEGIGFAGVGIKLGLLVAEEVLTETRRGKTHIATRWHLSSRQRAPWRWVEPPGLVGERGTAVQLQLRNALSPLLDPGFVEAVLRRHYRPLFDPRFAAMLAAHYAHGVHVHVNDRALDREEPGGDEVAPLEIRLLRKRKPSVIGYLSRQQLPLPEEQRGVAVSTLGKVIKQGWDWLGITPVTQQEITGLVEAPALAECLTLNKADFIRTGPRGAAYLAYRKAIQEAVAHQLARWGDVRDATAASRRRLVRPLERDLERVLMDLADEFPLVTTLVDRTRDGQRKLPMGRPASTMDPPDLVAAVASEPPGDGEQAPGAGGDGSEPMNIDAEAPRSPDPADVTAPESEDRQSSPSEIPPAPLPVHLPGPRGARRSARLSLAIQFEDRPDDGELARLVESTVWVNAAHPAYRRAVASRSEGYHVALSAALALAPLAVEAAREHDFVTAFLGRWGEALQSTKPRSARR